MRMIRKLCSAAVLLTGLLVLTGCMGRSADALYALPRQSEEYYALQTAIDGVMTGSCSYSAPVSGSNQQAVQLSDLDGDGQEEAIVFLKSVDEQPLKVHIFAPRGEAYESIALMEGNGSTFDSVEYADLDGQPGQEILVGKRISDQVLQSLSVYTCKDGRMVELLSTNYTEFRTVDLDGDDRRDLFLLRSEAEERAAIAELYRYENEQLQRQGEASLSVDAQSVRRIISGDMSPGTPAVFVASTYDEASIITDIFALRDGSFLNVSAAGETGLSIQTVRSYTAYATDIDSDGLIELPSLMALPTYEADSETFWLIDWYNLYPDGARQVKLTTYHNHSGGWYLTIPGSWHGNLTVSRSAEEVAGVRGLVFSRWNGRETAPEEIFTLYAFTGKDRDALASADGRFVVSQKGETVYSARLGTGPWALEQTSQTISDMFHFIQVNWNSGDVS